MPGFMYLASPKSTQEEDEPKDEIGKEQTCNLDYIVWSDENVLKLQVAMDNKVRVKILNSFHK
jgi:hypothetical protein